MIQAVQETNGLGRYQRQGFGWQASWTRFGLSGSGMKAALRAGDDLREAMEGDRERELAPIDDRGPAMSFVWEKLRDFGVPLE